MLSFEEFVNIISENIKSWLPMEYKDAKIEVKEVLKPNVSYMGMTISRDEDSITPTLNLNEAYDYLGEDKEEEIFNLMRELADFVVTSNEIPAAKMPDFDINDYNSVKDHLFFRLCNTEKNEEYLKDVPHTEVEDLSMIYAFVIPGANDSDFNSTVINNATMKKWGVSLETLHKDAMGNGSKILSPEVFPLRDVLVQLIAQQGGLDEMLDFLKSDASMGPDMYVLSNHYRIFGASCALYPGVLDKIADKLDNSFYILPSTMHEVILVPDGLDIDYSGLSEIVKEINATEIKEKDFLSDTVYYFDAKERTFGKAEDHVKQSPEARYLSSILDVDVADFGDEIEL